MHRDYSVHQICKEVEGREGELLFLPEFGLGLDK